MSLDKNVQDPHGFDPEIREIERKIVEFFTAKSSEFTGRHPIVSMVMAYFYTRKNLTQRDLQILTGFSAGTVSKSVRQLVEMNVITKETIPGAHTHIYKMDTLPFSSPQYFLRTESFMEEKIRELEKMKKTLDDNAEEMKNFETYKKIYATVTQLLKLLPTTFVVMEKLKDVKKTKKWSK